MKPLERILLGLVLSLVCAHVVRADPSRWIDRAVERGLATQVALYKTLHAEPELSGKEELTSGWLARDLRDDGFEVTERVGGYGVVGVLRNGTGPTVLLRTEMDALPVAEKTGLSYASERAGAMHACGHDVHMSAWAGAARILSDERSRWHGTLVMVAQPSEEQGTGARAMLDDGLYARFPKPDFAFAIHDTERLPAGKVEFIPGYAGATVDTVEIVVRGKGGHGARPHLSVDPVVIGSAIVLRLQTIVSREMDPVDPAVVTVGSFQAGSAANVIPDEARLLLTVRSRAPETREHLLASIDRIARAEAQASGAPEPSVTVTRGPAAPYNDPALVDLLVPALRRELGEASVGVAESRSMGGEDFGEYAEGGTRVVMAYVGAIEPSLFAAWQAGTSERYGIHSALFAPDPEPTIRTGTVAAVASAVRLFDSR